MKKEERLSALKYLASLKSSDEFENPFDETVDVSNPVKIVNPTKKDTKKDKFDKLIEDTNTLTDNIIKDKDSYKIFDDYIEDMIENEEDINLKNSLINMGRKYSKNSTEEESEIVKEFNLQDAQVSQLITDVSKDIDYLQKDIEMARSVRARNPKAIAEMAEVKAQYHTIKLNAIKERSNIKKMKYDIAMKQSKNVDSSDDAAIKASKAIQTILQMGHGNLIENAGGRTAISGARTSSTDFDYENRQLEETDEYLQNKYFGNSQETESDIYLKYEKEGPHWILIIDSAGKKSIITEDKYGNLIPEYPVPKDIDNLAFNVDKSSNTAIDQYKRAYDVRYTT